MSFANDIEERALPLRRAILAHPFITGVGDGALDVEKFKYYVKQDYVYLIEYSRVLALAAARAPDLETLTWFAELLNAILNNEMNLHREYCAEFGITVEDLEATEAAPANMAYTSFLLKVAHQGSFGELVAALLPCQWGYWEIGDHLARLGAPQNAPLYRQWIEMYSSAESEDLAKKIRALADRLGEEAGPTEQKAMGEAYLTSFRLELRFWQMSYSMEEWGS